jgi:hypothetical protein
LRAALRGPSTRYELKKEASMAQRGVVKVDKVEWRGVVYPILLNKETGVFSAHIPNPDQTSGRHCPLETFRGELPDVKSKLEKYLKEADGKDLQWTPLILVKHKNRESLEYGRKDQHSLNLDYARGFRAKTMSGKMLWREFIGNDHDDLDLKMREYNSDPPYWRTDAIELAYTPERWSSLRIITETMNLMNERLQAILQGGVDEVSKMLTGISEKGAQLLLPAPKKVK